MVEQTEMWEKPKLDYWPTSEKKFAGADYVPARDQKRLKGQLGRV